jgi:hypothetical protein
MSRLSRCYVAVSPSLRISVSPVLPLILRCQVLHLR